MDVFRSFSLFGCDMVVVLVLVLVMVVVVELEFGGW